MIRFYRLHPSNPWVWGYSRRPSDHWDFGLGRFVVTTEPK